jgi:hypothetical protein
MINFGAPRIVTLFQNLNIWFCYKLSISLLILFSTTTNIIQPLFWQSCLNLSIVCLLGVVYEMTLNIDYSMSVASKFEVKK